MGRFPFDRLLRAVAPLCADRRVYAQTGPSTVALPCPTAPYLPADELARLLAEVPIVITHAGNTVRLVQNLGKVPIAVARRADHGEMADDHQLAYVEHERAAGRIIVADADPAALRAAVDGYDAITPALLLRPLPAATPPDEVADRLDGIVHDLVARGGRRRRARSDA
jgi:hypothetical protein